ncbi:MAG: ABC transporter ATP-binding protein [Bacteroidota bacterium]|nr:ABC transporter ATP-binding protein [Bacteroidota bacterium]MDX5431286.1 ABC transporter ATP-binding protein [Bacteroidota bacterium]MDX5470024.1 ABC transporter ATP-binding protein [Bacteroidota bacterium]
MVEAIGIRKKYGKLEVLKDIHLKVEEGEVVSIVGASGAGKSTLLQILGTLDSADQGELIINGTQVNKLNKNGLADFRNRHLGFVFQFHHLLPEFTALENACFPAFIQGIAKDEAESRARQLLERLGLKDRYHHKPNELSGGEQQRVAVARALINKPAVVFADEPSGNLDSANSRELHDLFFELRKELNQTFIIVTHNEELAAKADRCLTIQDGRILE